MTTQEEARKAMVEARQKEEHIQQTILSRAEENLEETTNSDIAEEARESIAQKRQEEKNLRESVLSRSEEAIHPSS